jgi:HEPN domain-containing protein
MNRFDEVREWLKFSDNDLEAVHQLSTFYPPKIEIICYLCQQSAEKALKAFWVYSGMQPPKTHNMDTLRAECEKLECRFLEIADECSRLDDYSSQPRYPSDMELISSDMELAKNDSTKINAFVKSVMSLDDMSEDSED